MRRAALVALVLFLPIAVILTLLAVQGGSPRGWQAELEKYKAYKESQISDSLVEKRVDRATMPWHFSGIMSGAVYGENSYFGTDYGYDGRRSEGGSNSLPYPPESVWCILLASEFRPSNRPDGGQSYLVVFVAEHQDMYNAALVVHEAAGARLALVESLALVGCNEVMEEIQFDEAGQWT